MSSLLAHSYRRKTEIRNRLQRPPNAVIDASIALKHPKGFTGWQIAEAKRQVEAKAEEARRRADIELTAQAIAGYQKPIPRDWLVVCSKGEKEQQLPRRFLDEIIATVAAYFGLSVLSICRAGRDRRHLRPRQIAMFLARELSDKSYPQIAKRFKRDHTTCIHAVERIQELMATDDELKTSVCALREILNEKLAIWRAEPSEDVLNSLENPLR